MFGIPSKWGGPPPRALAPPPLADPRPPTVGELFAGIPTGAPNQDKAVLRTKSHWISILRQGENLRNLPEEEVRRREAALGLPHLRIPKSFMDYRRLDASKVGPTMVFGNNCLPVHPTEDRNVTVREAATIQGFAHGYEFMGGASSQYKQVGNAVPPMYSLRLAKAVGDALEAASRKA